MIESFSNASRKNVWCKNKILTTATARTFSSRAPIRSSQRLEENSTHWHRAVCTWVSKVIRNCFGVVLPCSLIGSKISRQFFIQSELKPKPVVARSYTFSRGSRQFDWFTEWSLSFVIVEGARSPFVIAISNPFQSSPFSAILVPFCPRVTPVLFSFPSKLLFLGFTTL